MKRNRYDKTFKKEAVPLALSGKLNYAKVARDLGLNYKTLSNWITQTMKNPKPSVGTGKSPSKQDYQALDCPHERITRRLLRLAQTRSLSS